MDVVLTRRAEDFVRPLAMAAITGRPVHRDRDLFRPDGQIRHVDLAHRAEIAVVAPATASFLARLAQGEASDLLVATLLGTRCPLILAPAMEEEMWRHPAVQANVDRLVERGALVVGPETGRLASGATGAGRMSEPEAIVEAVFRALCPQDLAGRRILVTAGPTREHLDDVRFISNASSGRMGWALAEAAKARGADVVLVSGPVSLGDPWGIPVHRVTSAEEMAREVRRLYDGVDTVLAAAAVADAAPARRYAGKADKGDLPATLDLAPTEDILAWAGAHKDGRHLVGFALQAGLNVEKALEKLRRKSLDLIVLNDVGEEGAGPGALTNHVLILGPQGPVGEVRGPKSQVAHAVLDALRGDRS